MTKLARVAVYCGSNPGKKSSYAEAAASFARVAVRRGINIVYGGGKVGLMGVVADAALAAGGEVDGVLPEFLQQRELGHDGLTRLHLVRSMHERKAKMAELADGFVALPGGLGTWEEIIEMSTWTQLALHTKPVALLDVDGYYAGLRALLSRAVEEGFMLEEHRSSIVIDDDPDRLLDAMTAWHPSPTGKWDASRPGKDLGLDKA